MSTRKERRELGRERSTILSEQPSSWPQAVPPLWSVDWMHHSFDSFSLTVWQADVAEQFLFSECDRHLRDRAIPCDLFELILAMGGLTFFNKHETFIQIANQKLQSTYKTLDMPLHDTLGNFPECLQTLFRPIWSTFAASRKSNDRSRSWLSGAPLARTISRGLRFHGPPLYLCGQQETPLHSTSGEDVDPKGILALCSFDLGECQCQSLEFNFFDPWEKLLQIPRMLRRGALVLKEQSARAFIPMVAFQEDDFYLFCLDRECLRHARIHHWATSGLAHTAAVLRSLECGTLKSLGFLPLFNNQCTIPRALLSKHLPRSSSKPPFASLDVSVRLSRLPSSIFGRNTWVASSKERLKVVKLQWSRISSSAMIEGDIIARLNAAFPTSTHFPALVYASKFPRFPFQTTRISRKIVHRQLHLTITSYSKPLIHLHDLKSPPLLFKALATLVTAIEQAAEAGFMHRDISIHNVMASVEGEAVLIDWDHAIAIDDTAAKEPAGTEHFMALDVGTAYWSTYRGSKLRLPFTQLPRHDLESILFLCLYILSWWCKCGKLELLEGEDGELVWEEYAWDWSLRTGSKGGIIPYRASYSEMDTVDSPTAYMVNSLADSRLKAAIQAILPPFRPLLAYWHRTSREPYHYDQHLLLNDPDRFPEFCRDIRNAFLEAERICQG